MSKLEGSLNNFSNNFNLLLKNNNIILVLARLLETFFASAIPSAVTMYILSYKPIIRLMYVLYAVDMLICLAINVYFWFTHMLYVSDWKKYLRLNLVIYLIFAFVSVFGFFTAKDPRLYTTIFGAYRALEVLQAKTIISVIVLNLFSVIALMLTGKLGMNFKKHSHHSASHRKEI